MTVTLRSPIQLLQTRFRQIPQRLVTLVALGMPLWWLLVAPVQSIEISRTQLEHADGGRSLPADFDFDLPNSLEGTVNKSVALYFLVEFELIRPHWYWFDDHTTSATRVARLSHHPLTRQYRVSTGGLQVPSSQLKDVIGFMQCVCGRRVFKQRAVKAGETVQTGVRMCPNVTQPPKPLQISAVNTRDWNLSSEWKRFNLPVPNEPPPAPPPAPAAPSPGTPTSTPPTSGSSGLSSDPGWRMNADPLSPGTLPMPAK